jgi:uncharacterized protein YdhG (YjbR/CyaY superfamily)
MVKSAAKTADEYLSELPEDRRAVVSQMRDLVRKNLPEGYVESVNWGMLSYEVPLETYPNTYNKQPLGYAALAAQKSGYSIYLMGAWADPAQVERLRTAFAAAGKKLDMGKSCVRFKKIEDLELNAIAQAIRSTSPEQYIALYEAGRQDQ